MPMHIAEIDGVEIDLNNMPRTLRIARKRHRKLMQRSFSHATAFRALAFERLDSAAYARKCGARVSHYRFLIDARNADEMARHIRADTAIMLPV